MTRQSKTGVYQYRRRIPGDVRALLGGGATHVKASLRTRNPAEAAALFRKVDAEHEAAWTQVRLGVQDCDERQATALAGELYREMLAKWPMRNPVAMHTWTWLKGLCEEFDGTFERRFGSQAEYVDGLRRLHGERLDDFLKGRGMTVSPAASERLLEATHRAVKLGIDQMLRETAGDWTPDRALEKFPPVQVVVPPDPKQQFEAVWRSWLLEAKPADSTVRRWKPALTRMFDALGTTDLSKVTEEMLIEWCDARLGAGVHNNTVGKVDLTVAKRMFKFAKRRKIIPSNPAVDVVVSSGARYQRAMRGFEPHEAAVILRATLEPPSKRMAPTFAAARRWVPWICAYTGARVNEVTQARACDFSTVDGTTILHVTAEAGTAKTGDRKVPLHRDLVDQGFLAFLATKGGKEPLFYAPRDGAPAGIPPYAEMGGRLSKWVRRLGLTDLRLDPNHAWRHRFKGYAAKAGIDERVADALQGHAPTTQGRKYGEVDIEERIAAVRKLPRIAVTTPPEEAGRRRDPPLLRNDV